MVFLITDTGEYREPQVPSEVSIGRGEGNALRPANGSISGRHCVIYFKYIEGTNKVEAWLEDLKARNGTYVGPGPLEMERVTEKMKLNFGDYIRLGNYTKFFRYVESMPRDADIPPSELIVSPSKPLQHELKNPASYASSNQLRMSATVVPALREDQGRGEIQSKASISQGTSLDLVPAITSQPLISPPQVHSRLRPSSSGKSHTFGEMGQNMSIHINYPTASAGIQQNPLSITIDPANERGSPSLSYQTRQQYRRDPSLDPVNQPGYGSAAEQDIDMRNSEDQPGGYDLLRAGKMRSSSPAKFSSSDRVNFVESIQQNGAGIFHDTFKLDDAHESSRPSVQQQNDRQRYNTGNSAFGGSGLGDPGLRVIDEDLPVYPSSRSTTRPVLPPKRTFNSAWQPESLMRKSRESNDMDMGYAPPGTGAATRYPQTSSPTATAAFRGPPQLNPRNHFAEQDEKGHSPPVKFADAQPKHSHKKASHVTRRSWPEGLRPPSSLALSKFVDMLLDQEIGLTFRHYNAPVSDVSNPKDSKLSRHADNIYGQNKNLRQSQVQGNVLPKNLPEFVLSEAIADSLVENGSTANTMISAVITDLNDLLRQTLLGSNMSASDVVGTSADFDYALESILCSIIKSSAKVLNDVAQLGIVVALEDVSSKEVPYEHSLPFLVRNSAESLIRTNAFMMGAYLEQEAAALRPEQKYEIVSLTVSNILDKLDACNMAILSISQKVDSAAMEHASAKTGLFHGNLSMELEQLRRLKKEADLTPIIEKIRQQESERAEEKYLRFHRFCEILFGYQLKSSFLKLKVQMKLRRRQKMLMRDFCDRRDGVIKKKVLQKFISDWNIARKKKVTLFRFERVVGPKLRLKTARFFKKWQELIRNPSILSAEAANTVAKLKGEILNLKATLHELSKKSELVANFAAERCLNRELSATNLELRHSLQKLEMKMLDIADVPASKRRDLVYNFLMSKEDEIVEANRERRFLKNELDQLTDLNAVFASNVMNRRLPDPSPTLPARSSPETARYNPAKGSLQAQKFPARTPAPSQQMYMRGNANDMTKHEATQIVYNELRRLKDSLIRHEEEKGQLQEKMANETSKNIQNTLAIQSLQSRLTKLERSCSSLRELLKQRVGETGLLELIDALDAVGAGGYALIETSLTDGEGSTPVDSPQSTTHFEDNRGPSYAPFHHGRKADPSFPTSKYGREVDNALYR